MKDFTLFVAAILFGLILTPLARKAAVRYKILDYPESRKMHERPTPLLGGVAIYLAFLFTLGYLALTSSFAHTRPFLGVLLGATLILVVSLFDDIRELSTFTRLLFQFLGSFIMILFGVKVSFLPPGIWGDIGEIVITFLWVIGITNAMNFLDGLDGLACGLSIIAGIFFYVVGKELHQLYFAGLVLALAGVCLGFLPYNFPVPFLYLKRALKGGQKSSRPLGGDRARIFLGDCGATFLGSFYAGISVMGDLATHNVIALSVPILLLGIPIFDTTFITIMRIRERKISDLTGWLAYAGKDHFHHRLVDLGFSNGGAVFFIYCVAIVLGIDAILIQNMDPFGALLVLLKVALLFILIALLMVTGRRTAIEEEKKQRKTL
ncbi:MAG: undecaprenyl/decaprenyl-phosphate alpha-N-acetylglucosaminyl 1-phosphate transferase [Candidatus Omnitrophica bacterium]|nr:undecaprenyl/decaprenyl-phosphate alpha-N-acetylglucosaminyl 1-phosphate transferase [Candidatus Omnitrophota bacterium]